MKQSEEEDLRALLPWLVNDTLPATEREQLEALLTSDREAAEEADFLRRLAGEVKADTPDSIVSEFGWARLQRQLNTSTQSVTPKPARLWQGAAVAAMLVIAIQAGWMMNLQREHVALNTQLLSGSPAQRVAGQSRLRVMFEADATSQQIEQLLRSVSATVVSGPSPLGLYDIMAPAVSAEQQAALIDQLSASPVIRHVELLDHP